MRFDILTIFPQIFSCYLNESMMKRAQAKKLLNFNVVNIRDYATDKHKTVDDRPYGGGPGMVMKIEPIYRALRALKIRGTKSKIQNKKTATGDRQQATRVILLSAKGGLFTQNDAKRLAKYDRLVLICGRYEGVDERVADYLADEELSIGPYVLTGGELPAMVVIDSVSRHLPGFLGKVESLKEESYETVRLLPKKINEKSEIRNLKFEISQEYPQYTRPEVFLPKKGLQWKVPMVLLTGDHKKITDWRRNKMKKS